MRIQFYYTLGCHLCEMAEQMLAEEMRSRTLLIDMFDIAEDEELLARYGVRIPVLRRPDNGKELDWPFDMARLRLYLSE